NCPPRRVPWSSGSWLRRLRPSDDFPAFQLGHRLAFPNAHEVAILVGLRLVMRVVLLRPPYGLAQHGMDEAALHFDHHGLGVRVADHHALKHAFWHRRLLFLLLRARRALGGLLGR